MSDELIVSTGELLGELPFVTADGDQQRRLVFMSGGHMHPVDEALAEVLRFCEVVRATDEMDAWAAERRAGTALAACFDAGYLLRGEPKDASRWLGECILRTAGRSIGLTAGPALTLVAPDGESFDVSPTYYWLWVFARSQRPISVLLRFMREQAGVEVDEETGVSAAVLHMLATGLARADRPSDATYIHSEV